MVDDHETAGADGFWVTNIGCDNRHSDGTAGEEAMLFTMLHDIGWIDVEVRDCSAVVRLNPTTVNEDALDALHAALKERAPRKMVELVLIDRDASPVTIAFLEAASACHHLTQITRQRPVDGEDGSVWGREAFPMPLPYALSDTLRFPLIAPSARDADDLPFVDEERFAGTLTTSEWLAPLNTVDSLEDRRLTDRTPEMVSFALRSLGWIAVKRPWNRQHRPFHTSTPEVVALDPAAVSRESLNQLMALTGAWSHQGRTLTFAWWNGAAWVREFGMPDEVADRLRSLCRIAANDEPMTLVDSVELPINRVLGSGSAWADDHPFRVALRRWQDERAGAGSSEAILRDLERRGLFQQRTKLLVVDENEDMRIARYAPGSVRVWDERAHRAMEGSRLVDVPDRGLGLSVQRDLQTVHRRREPVLHRCSGVIAGSDSLQAVQWSRLTVPLFQRIDGRERVHALLSTCELERALPI